MATSATRENRRPDTGAQKMAGVDGHGERRAGADGGGVTGGAHEGQRERAERQRLDAGGDPVTPLREIRTNCEKRRQDHQDAMTGQPDESRPRVEDGVQDGARLERGLGAALEEGRAHEQPDVPEPSATRRRRRPHTTIAPSHRRAVGARDGPARRSMKKVPTTSTEEAR